MEVVRVGGPVHADEVVARLRAAWGIPRAGSRIQAHADRAAAVAYGRLEDDGGFLSIPGATVRVRNRADVASASLRRPEMLPPAEVRLALLDVARANLGASAEELVAGARRALGFQSLGSQPRETLQAQLTALEADGKLEKRGDLYVQVSREVCT